MKVKILLLTVIIAANSAAQAPEAVLQKRAGAEEGAKPCKYKETLRPCVLLTPQRLKQVRQNLKNEQINEAYENIKQDADVWLTRTIEIPPMGGWIHDYFCEDGVQLEIPADKIFNDSLPSRCPVCGKTYLNPKIIAARNSYRHYWLCEALRSLSLVYALEGKRDYGLKALEILTKYADAYPNQAFMRQTLEEAVLLIPAAESYDLLYPLMTPRQREHICRNFLHPSAQLLSRSGIGGNWGSWHLSAVGVVGYATRHQRFIDYATEMFKSQMLNQLGDDGLWPESVHTYHFYPLSGFISFAEAAANNGDTLYNLEVKPGKSLKEMFTAPLRFVYPNFRIPAINDGWFEAFPPFDQYTWAYYRYRLPELAWAVRMIEKTVAERKAQGYLLSNAYRHVLYGENLPEQPQAPDLKSVNFPVLGIAILRQGSPTPPDREMMMTFDYGPFLGHGQRDKMGVTFFAGGKLLSADYGTTGYGSPANRFLTSTKAHNTIAVDGKDQPPTKDSRLTSFEAKAGVRFASALTEEIAAGTLWRRTVALTDHYALIIDQITGDSIRRYDWYFHAEGKIDSITPSLTESAFDAFKGNDLDVLFYKEPGLQAAVSSMPTGQGDKYIPLLNLQQTGTNATFIAVISPTNEKCRVYAMKTSDSSYFVYVVYDDAINDVIEIDKSIIYRLLYGKPADLTFTY